MGSLERLNRPMQDFHDGTRAPEAQVRVTFGLREQPADQLREYLASIPSANSDTIIGYPYLEPRHLGIQPKDVVFVRVDDLRNGEKTDVNCDVFSSFNGEIAESGIPQSEFDKRYLAVGVTQGGSDPDVKMGGDKSGIAVITHGATTITNYSEQTLTYGEFVAALPPSVDPVERDRFQKKMEALGAKGVIAGKHVGQLKKITYEDMVGGVEETIAVLLEDLSVLSIPGRATALQTGRPIDNGDTASSALNMKRFMSWAFFCAEMTARGNARLQSLRTSSDYPIVLAQTLGLINTPTLANAGISEDIDLLKDFFSRALVSSLNSTDLYDQTVDAIENDLPRTVATVPVFGPRSSVPPTPTESLLREALVAYDLHWRSEAHLLERNSGNLLGMIISHSMPGEVADIVLHT